MCNKCLNEKKTQVSSADGQAGRGGNRKENVEEKRLMGVGRRKRVLYGQMQKNS